MLIKNIGPDPLHIQPQYSQEESGTHISDPQRTPLEQVKAPTKEPETIFSPLMGFSLEDLRSLLEEKQVELAHVSERLHRAIENIVHKTPLPTIVKERLQAFERDHDMTHFYERSNGTRTIATYFDELDPETGLVAFRKLHALAYQVVNLSQGEIPRYKTVIRMKTPPPLPTRHDPVRRSSVNPPPSASQFHERRAG